MNKLSKLLILLMVIVMLTGCFTACGDTTPPDSSTESSTESSTSSSTPDNNKDDEIEFVDYAAQLKFNPNSGKKWAYVTVKSYIDGDTTHFYIDHSEIPEGYVKARYLGINTPESTGLVEPWGKKASNYTKTQLQKAEKNQKWHYR